VGCASNRTAYRDILVGIPYRPALSILVGGRPALRAPLRDCSRSRGCYICMSEDPTAIGDALAYVVEMYRELAQENGAPTLGIQNQIVEYVLRDEPALAAARNWVTRSDANEARLAPNPRLPQDAAYWRVRERMLAAMGKSPGAA